MAYNTSKGDRELGDIKNENDPDTQIDFETDQISLKTGGVNRLTATNTHVSCSVNHSASNYYGGNFYGTEFFGDLDGAIRFNAINKEGDGIAKGQVVYISGTQGQTPTVALAACDDPAKMPAFGLAASNAAIDAEFQIVTFGSLQNIDLTSVYGKTFAVGDTLYVETGSGGTSGSLTNVKPKGNSNLLQNMGKVVRNGGGADGQIKVGGAGRTNATPNLDKGYLFVGDETNGSTQDNTVFISSSANKVGINTTNPTHALSIVGDISGSGELQIAGAATISGSLRAKQIRVTHHSWTATSTAFSYVPWYSQVEAGSPGFAQCMIAPFNGRLLRVLWRSSNAQGGSNVTASVNTGSAGDNGPNSVASETVVATPIDDVWQVTTFNFTNAQHFTAGETITIGIKPASSAGSQNATCVWEFDMFNV